MLRVPIQGYACPAQAGRDGLVRLYPIQGLSVTRLSPWKGDLCYAPIQGCNPAHRGRGYALFNVAFVE